MTLYEIILIVIGRSGLVLSRISQSTPTIDPHNHYPRHTQLAAICPCSIILLTDFALIKRECDESVRIMTLYLSIVKKFLHVISHTLIVGLVVQIRPFVIFWADMDLVY